VKEVLKKQVIGNIPAIFMIIIISSSQATFSSSTLSPPCFLQHSSNDIPFHFLSRACFRDKSVNGKEGIMYSGSKRERELPRPCNSEKKKTDCKRKEEDT